VRPERLELPAYWFEASRSIQLSYGRTFLTTQRQSSTGKRTGFGRTLSRFYQRTPIQRLKRNDGGGYKFTINLRNYDNTPVAIRNSERDFKAPGKCCALLVFAFSSRL
jgi:hypothetical protein